MIRRLECKHILHGNRSNSYNCNRLITVQVTCKRESLCHVAVNVTAPAIVSPCNWVCLFTFDTAFQNGCPQLRSYTPKRNFSPFPLSNLISWGSKIQPRNKIIFFLFIYKKNYEKKKKKCAYSQCCLLTLTFSKWWQCINKKLHSMSFKKDTQQNQSPVSFVFFTFIY